MLKLAKTHPHQQLADQIIADNVAVLQQQLTEIRDNGGIKAKEAINPAAVAMRNACYNMLKTAIMVSSHVHVRISVHSGFLEISRTFGDFGFDTDFSKNTNKYCFRLKICADMQIIIWEKFFSANLTMENCKNP